MKAFLVTLLVGLVCTTVITWPFLPNIADYYTDQGDYATHGSIFWWNQDSIKTGRIFTPQEYWQGYMFYPHPYSFAFANTSVFPSLVFAPFYWMSGSLPFSFNLYLFLSFVGSFMAAFYTIGYFLSITVIPAKAGIHTNTGSRISKLDSADAKIKYGMTMVSLASFVGAFVFAFNPQTMTRFPQHVELLGKFFLPLIFLFGFKFFEKPTVKNAFWLSLFITLNGLTANYFQVFVAVILPLAGLPFLVKAALGKDWKYFWRLGKLSLIGLVFLPIILYFNVPFWDFSQKEGAFRSIEESIFFSGRINDWMAPPPNNLIYGGWSQYLFQFREPKDNRGILNFEEHTLFISILATVLFFIGLKQFSGSRVKHGMTGAGKWYFLILLIVPFILIFGPFFPASEDGLRLPFYFLHEWIPIMKGIRAPARFEYIFMIPFALIVSLGALVILKRFSGNKSVIPSKEGIQKEREAGSRVRPGMTRQESNTGLFLTTGVILLILTLENYTIKDFSSRSAVLTKLDSETVKELSFLNGKTTLHLPIYTTDDADRFGKNSYASTWATRMEERIVNGNSGYFPPDSLQLLFEIREDVNEEALRRLSVLGVDYVIFHEDLLSPEERAGFVKNAQLYKNGVIYNGDNLIVVDIAKYNFDVPVCAFARDFKVRAVGIEGENSDMSYSLIVQNVSDCFLPNIYGDRYKSMEVETELGVKTAEFRLPMLIRPFEQIILSEENKELRIE